MTSKLDEDLRAALGDEPPSPVVRGPAPVPPPRGNVGLLVGLLVVAGAVVVLVMTSFKDAAVYAMPVDRLVAAKGALGQRRLRVEGNLVHGSLEKRDQPCEYRFRLAKGGEEVAVRYAQCVVPDTFRDVPGMDVGVTVEGKVAADGAFEATQVLAKCPSKYEMKDRAARGEAMPHGDVAGAAAP